VKLTITHMTGSKAGLTETLDAPVITVGRGDGNLLHYDPHQDDKVSTFHARLEEQGGQVFLVDLDSTNGTFVNGQRIQGSVPLISGAVVTFGEDGGPSAALQFGVGAPPPAAGSPAGPGQTAPAKLAKTDEVPIPGGGGAPPPGGGGAPPPAQKPAGGGAGKKLLAGGILGTIAALLFGCLLFTLVIALNRKVRGALPPWAVRIVRKIPGVNKLMKTPTAPRLPGGIRTPRLPTGGGRSTPGRSPEESPPDEEDPGEPPPDEESPPDEDAE